MITAYKMAPDYLAAKLSELQAQVGADKPLLPIFVEQTRKVIERDRKAYLRYGPYWWAVKAVLAANGVDAGTYREPIWEKEYTGETPELTLLAAWEFAEDNMGTFGVQTNEYDLDGTTFLLFDPDQNARGK